MRSLRISFQLSLFRAALSAVLVACMASFAVCSWRWPLVGDAPLMHYCVFLMQHGFAPYRQIIDLNQPGTFATEAAVMSVLGKGALAWRVWDLLLLAATGVAMAAICGRQRWFPALFAGATFALIHGRDGLINTGQRDLLMAALLLASCALLTAAVRGGDGAPGRGAERKPSRERYGVSLPAGLCLGAAAAVKPVAVVFAPVLLLMTVWELRRKRRQWGWHGALIAAGVLLPLFASLLFLAHERVLTAFAGLMTQLAPYHASLWRLAPGALLGRSVSSVLLPLFCLWLPLLLAERQWRSFEDRVLLVGFLFGVASFCVQGRGYPYHRYPSEVFLLLLSARAFDSVLWHGIPSAGPSLVGRRLLQGCAVAGLAFGALIVTPRSLWEIAHFDGQHDPFGDPLRADLLQLSRASPDGLNNKVQCLDMAGGCVATLYRLGLVESSGLLYDCYLYPAVEPEGTQTAERDRYRLLFAQALVEGAPQAVVVSSDECGPPDFAYHKLSRWPWLRAYLGAHYTLVREEMPRELERWGGRPMLPYGYRVYWRVR